MILTELFICIILILLLRFYFTSPVVPLFIAGQVMIASSGLFLRSRGWVAIGGMAEILALFTLSGVLSAILSMLLAASALPYQDDNLILIDRKLFNSDWYRLILYLDKFPDLIYILNYAYASLSYQPYALFACLFATGRMRSAQSFCAAWIAALMMTVAIFPLVPALGGYLYYHIPRSDTHVLIEAAWRFIDVLASIRNGTLHTLDASNIEGIITFPSFHAAAAVLLIYGFWPLHKIRIIAIALNTAMMVSTVIVGGHYLVDVLAGSAIAITSIMLVEFKSGRQTSLAYAAAAAHDPGCSSVLAQLARDDC